jgi:hypothetical protein
MSIAPLAATRTPAASKPTFSTLGQNPMQMKARAACVVADVPSAPVWPTVTWSPWSVTLSTRADVRIDIPRRR